MANNKRKAVAEIKSKNQICNERERMRLDKEKEISEI